MLNGTACNFIKREATAQLFSCKFCNFLEQILSRFVQRCSLKKLLLKVSQNSQENICAWAPFLIGLQLY